MDITAFEADGSGSDTLIMEKAYHALPSLPKALRRPAHITISIGGHVLKLAVLIIALAGCVVIYSLGIVWICLFRTQAKLLIITAALLRSCLDDQLTDADVSNPVAVQEPLEDVQADTASAEKDEHAQCSARSDHDLKAELVITTQREAETAEHDEWGDSPEDTQTELANERHNSSSPTEGWPKTQSFPTKAEQESEPAISLSHQQEDVFEDNGRSSSPAIAQLEPIEEEQYSPPPTARRGGTRPAAAAPKPVVSKEEKKAQAQTAWLNSMGSGTAATRSATPAVRDTGFTAEQVAEAASFMRGATRGGMKQPPKPTASIRGSKPSVTPGLKPRHPNAGSPFVKRTAEASVPQQPRRADPSAPLAPHLRKAREAREKNRTSTEDAPQESTPVAQNRVKYGTANENETPLKSTASHEERTCVEPVAATAVDREVEKDNRPVLAGTQSLDAQKANETTTVPQISATVGASKPAAVRTESLEPQAVTQTTSEGTENECATNEGKPERVVYDVDTLKSFDTNRSLTPVLGADIERAQRFITANNTSTNCRSPIFKKTTGVQSDLPQPKRRSLGTANNARIRIVDPGTTSAPQESAAASVSAERSAAVEHAVDVLNQQAHQKRQSLGVVNNAVSNTASSAAAGVVQDPAVMFCSPERTGVNEDSSDTIDQQMPSDMIDEKAPSETVSLFDVKQSIKETVSTVLQESPSIGTGYAHADLLDLDFTPSPTSKPLAPASHRRDSSLAPTAPPFFFAPSPGAVPSRAIPIRQASEHVISEETEDTLEFRRQHAMSFAAQPTYQSVPPYPGWGGSPVPGHAYEQNGVTYQYPHQPSHGQYPPTPASYGYQHVTPQHTYPQTSQPQYYLPVYSHEQRMLLSPKTAKLPAPSQAVSIVKPTHIPDALNYKSEQEFPSLPSSRKTTEVLARPPGINTPQPNHQAAFDTIVADGSSTARSEASLSEPAEVDVSEHHDMDIEHMQSERSTASIAGAGDNLDPPLESSASNLWGVLGDEETNKSANGLSRASSSADAARVVDEEVKPVNAKKALKERKKAARDSLLAAWYQREVARKKVRGSWSLEGMQALEAATLAYNTERSELQQCMGDGKLNSPDAECFPTLSVNDLAAPKHRPAGAEEAYREQKSAEEVSMHIEVEEEPIFSELNELRKKLFIAHHEYDKAIAFFKGPPPQGRKDVRVLHAEGKARIERAKNFYHKKRDALKTKFPQDPWLIEKFKPDPWHGFEVPDVVRAGRQP